MTTTKQLAIGVATILLFTTGTEAVPAGPSVTVVELFTSQGCSSCPPANANLIKLSASPDVLTLSYSVTYWDHLGWKDIFGDPAFTARQAAYEPKLGQSGPFTPQMVINGKANTVGYDLAEVSQLVAAADRIGTPKITLDKAEATIAAGHAPLGGADVWVVRYEPGIINVPVARGENTGRTLPHVHVVRHLVRAGSWTGQQAQFQIPAARPGLRTAVLVQKPEGGPILSATTD
jgi:hypothetical protein